MKKKQLYKVFGKGRKSPFQGMIFALNKDYHCEDFNEDKTVDCAAGFYAVDIEGLPCAWNVSRQIYAVEVWGKSVKFNQYKWRHENIRILRKCTKKEIFGKAKAIEGKLGYLLSEVLWPVNPLMVKPKKIDYKERLQTWASVWASVGDSVGDSVWASVRDSVWDSVWASVWDSVGDSVGASVRDSVWDSVWDSVGDSVWASVWDSVWAYSSSLFPNIKKWKYIDHPEGENPFQPCIDLWRAGYVPSFDGRMWRLHVGTDAKIVYELEAE